MKKLDRKLKKALNNNLKDLKEFQNSLFEQGHVFWYCDGQDKQHGKPFYYYQINKTVNMATCHTCYKLIENRKKIRNIEKILGIDLTPLTSNFKETKHLQRMSISSKSEWNPNASYLL